MSTGSIIKRGPSWLLKYDAGKDPTTGKRIQRYATVRGTKREAQAELRRLLGEVDTGTAVDPSAVTVAEWAQVWLQVTVKPNVSLKTYEGYALNLTSYVGPVLGSVCLQKLTPIQIQAFLTDLQTTGKGKFGKQPEREGAEPEGLSAQTVLHIYRNLFSCLKAAVKARLLIRNPAEDVDAPNPARGQSASLDSEDCGPIHALERDEVQALLNGISGKHIHPLAVLALGTGARRGELLALRWSDVDLDRKTIRINRALERTREGGLRIKPPKNQTSRRTISIDDGLVATLRNHRQGQEDLARQLGVLCPVDGLIFPCIIRRSRGRQSLSPMIHGVDFTRPWNPDAVTKDFHRAATGAGFPEFRFHDMRHTHATQLLTAGIPVHIVAARLGHSTPVITLKVYAHVLPRADEAAARVMGELMRTALGSGS